MTPQEYLDWCRDMSERMKKYEYHFTNADRIRSMTDEELAKYFAWLVDNEFPPCCEWEMYGDATQINAWLEWLEDEVKT